MLNNKKKFVAALSILFMIIFGFFSLSWARIPEKGDKISIFCFAINEDNKIEFNNPLFSILESILIENGFKVHTPTDVPLVSKEILQYTIVKNKEQKDVEDKTGRVYLELGSDGSAKIESENGLAAYTKVEISSLEWELDKKKALESLEATDSTYALFLTATSEDITESLSKKFRLSGQRSVRASIIMSLVELEEKIIVKSFYDEIPSMDTSVSSAAIKGWRILINNGINEWFKNEVTDK
ncbi:MAG: hypothetical protein KAW92_11595 [Candidatus Cloacimonetes bacterium]|nr:hypothetical protein [Candidatus Cloacimonadota bacterium]